MTNADTVEARSKWPPRKRILVLSVLVAVAIPSLYVLILLLGAVRHTPSVLQRAAALEESGIRVQDLPEEWVAILLKVEDPEFYEHSGVDLSTPGAGLTTITQGLVKLHYFDSFRPGPHAKLKQTLCALVLDSQLEKNRQLTLFLNTADLGLARGVRVVGFADAARAYYGKPLSGLSRVEYIGLVAMLIGPNAYHPTREPEALAERVSRIEALIEGRCEPIGHEDVYYDGCSG